MLPRNILPIASVALLAVLPSGAQDINMAHKNSVVGVNTNGVVESWKVDGVENLGYQALFYRVGNVGGEKLLGAINPSPSVTFNQVPNIISSLDITFANASYSVRTLYQLSGGNAGSGKANLSETLTIQNLSSSPLDFHFFQLSDFDLNGVADGQTASVVFDSLAQPYKIVQTDGVRSLTETINVNSAPVSHYEISLYPALVNSLTDGAPTTLSDAALAGPGDIAFAYQWDVILDPSQSLTISKLMTIVPEPTSGALVLVATVLGVLTQRKRNLSNQ